MCNEFDLAIAEINAKVKEWDSEQWKFQEKMNETFGDREFLVVKDCFKTPYSTTGTNFKDRKCKLAFGVDHTGVHCHPIFQNKRTKEFDMRIDYTYGEEYFKLVEEG